MNTVHSRPPCLPVPQRPRSREGRLLVRLPSLAALMLIALAGGCGESEAERAQERQREAIRRVLATDAALTRANNKGLNEQSDLAAVSTAAKAYAGTLAALDMSELPEDVRTAYAKHIDAWKALAEFLDHYSGWTGSFRAGFQGGDFLKGQVTALQKGVDDTWGQVKAAAAAHGVDVPK